MINPVWSHYQDGITLIVLATYHIISMSPMYLKSLGSKRKKFQANTYVVQTICGRRLPVDSILKAVLPPLALVGNAITESHMKPEAEQLANGDVQYHHVMNHMHYQHITIILLFWLIGIIELLDFCKINLPPSTNYVVYTMILGCQSLLFYYHHPDEEKKPVVTDIHLMFVYILIPTLLVGLLEMTNRHLILPFLCTRYLFCLQGVWYLLAASIIYPFPWMWQWNLVGGEHQTMFLAFCFCACAAISFVYCLFLWLICCWRIGVIRVHEKSKKSVPQSSINGETILLLDNHVEDDIE